MILAILALGTIAILFATKHPLNRVLLILTLACLCSAYDQFTAIKKEQQFKRLELRQNNSNQLYF